MSHQHFCLIDMHSWECGGTALHDGEKEPSVCMCKDCKLPLEQGDHTKCEKWGGYVTCPQHIEEEKRRRKANMPRIIAYFKRRKARLDSTGQSTPESDQFYEGIIKRLESEE